MEKVNKNILHLDKISNKRKSEDSKEVSEVLSLLQSNENPEEIKILKQIGLDHHIKHAEEIDKNLKRFTVLEQKFNRNVYSSAEVKEYCISKGYRAVRVDRFKHEVPVEVGTEILKFAKENTRLQTKGDEVLGQRTIEICDINLQSQHFFLLTSIQAMKGAKVKHATLFYREAYSHDNYNYLGDNDMLIEVASWGTPGQDKSLMWEYLKAGEGYSAFLFLFTLIGLLFTIFGSNNHYIFLISMFINIGIVIFIETKDFFRWN